MVEPTRVPLQPIRKGSLLKLWLGILVIVAVAVLAAWWSAPKGVKVTEIVAGSGPHPTKEDVVFLDYVGKLPAGLFELPAFIRIEAPASTPGFVQNLHLDAGQHLRPSCIAHCAGDAAFHRRRDDGCQDEQAKHCADAQTHDGSPGRHAAYSLRPRTAVTPTRKRAVWTASCRSISSPSCSV